MPTNNPKISKRQILALAATDRRDLIAAGWTPRDLIAAGWS